MSKIEPALTPKEWQLVLHENCNEYHCADYAWAKVAVTAQELGVFTWEDVDNLRIAADYAWRYEDLSDRRQNKIYEELNSLIERIEALLPPRNENA